MASAGESTGIPIGLIVCGPCACGKSEVATKLANHFQVPFVDADSLHTETNIGKMSNGIPLTDQDRFPWLCNVRQEMIKRKKSSSEKAKIEVIGACSALKKQYRDILRGETKTSIDDSDTTKDLLVIFIFLNCSEPVLQQRLNERQGHFMKANMLSSQLAVVELPEETNEKWAFAVNGDVELDIVIEQILSKLKNVLHVNT